jgi:hypothetical protein
MDRFQKVLAPTVLETFHKVLAPNALQLPAAGRKILQERPRPFNTLDHRIFQMQNATHGTLLMFAPRHCRQYISPTRCLYAPNILMMTCRAQGGWCGMRIEPTASRIECKAAGQTKKRKRLNVQSRDAANTCDSYVGLKRIILNTTHVA